MRDLGRNMAWVLGKLNALMSTRGRAGGRVILSDCRLIDGAGNPWVAADVLIEGDRRGGDRCRRDHVAPRPPRAGRGRRRRALCDARVRRPPHALRPDRAHHSRRRVGRLPGRHDPRGGQLRHVGGAGRRAPPGRLRDDVGELLRVPRRDLAHVRGVPRRRRDGRLRDQRRRSGGSRRPAHRGAGLRRASGQRPRARGHEAAAGREHGRRARSASRRAWSTRRAATPRPRS